MNQIDGLKSMKGELNVQDIKKIIPYDAPFLFIDKVISLNNAKIVAVKQLSAQEDFFKGHFVGFPIMPGALTVEGMGQAATLLARYNISNHLEKDILAYKLKDVSFIAPILPGSEVRFEIESIAQDERGAVMRGMAFVKEAMVAEAYFMLAIVNKSDFRAKYAN